MALLLLILLLSTRTRLHEAHSHATATADTYVTLGTAFVWFVASCSRLDSAFQNAGVRRTLHDRTLHDALPDCATTQRQAVDQFAGLGRPFQPGRWDKRQVLGSSSHALCHDRVCHGKLQEEII